METMAYSALVTFREGLEVALILGMAVASLRRVGRPWFAGVVWGAAAAAGLTSLAFGAALVLAARRLPGSALGWFEGASMLAAAVLLTYVVFWVRGQATQRRVRSGMEAAGRSSPAALGLLVYALIVREGVETALLLYAGSAVGAAASYWTGTVAGLGAAAIAGYLVARGSSRLAMPTFFRLSGLVLILFAAGLVSNGLAELHDHGILRGLSAVWDTSGVLPHSSLFGGFLKALLGYDDSPSLLQVVVYGGYVLAALVAYFAPLRRRYAPGRAG